MNMEQYRGLFTAENLMGPNSAVLLAELLQACPLQFRPGDEVLDLGCGTGLTSLILARETGARIHASDLWISAEDNAARFKAWGVGEQVVPKQEDANHLRFAPKQFKAVFSVDSYHYFAGEEGFFQEKLLPFIADGGMALIAVPGLKNEFEGRAEELLSPWAGDEAYMFKTSRHWERLLGEGGRIAAVETWELEGFDQAWGDWLATDAPYAISDGKHFESIIRPCTCFVGMAVKVKA